MLRQASTKLSRYAMIGSIALSSAVAVGSMYAWFPSFGSALVRGKTSGVLGGNDFAMYYTASSLGAAGQWTDAYSLAGLASAMDLRLGAASFAYPPMLAQAIHPLTAVGYPSGLTVWFSISLLAVAVGVPVVFGRAGLIAIGAMGFPVYVALRFGQFVPMAIAALAISAVALRRNRPFLAGLAIGVLVLKPQFLVGPLLIAAFDPECRSLLRGMVASAASLSIVSFAISPSAWRAYLSGLDETARPDVSSRWDYSLLDRIDSLPTWALVSTYALLAATLSLAALSAARTTPDHRIKIALGLALSVALSPRMIVYDWSLLILVGIWMTPLLRADSNSRWAAALVVLGSLSGNAASPVNVGWITLAVATLIVAASIRSMEPLLGEPAITAI